MDPPISTGTSRTGVAVTLVAGIDKDHGLMFSKYRAELWRQLLDNAEL